MPLTPKATGNDTLLSFFQGSSSSINIVDPGSICSSDEEEDDGQEEQSQGRLAQLLAFISGGTNAQKKKAIYLCADRFELPIRCDDFIKKI